MERITLMFQTEHADVAQRASDMLDGTKPEHPKLLGSGQRTPDYLVIHVAIRNFEALLDQVAA